MRASAIVPVRDGARTLRACLEALRTAPISEVVVVDDGSNDGSGQIARDLGVRVVATDGTGSAAAARNRGATDTNADALLFVDADVVVSPEAVARLLEPLARGEADAAVGAYGPAPVGLGRVTRAKNTAIRANHARAGDAVSWFWTGFGAVRRDAFEAVGGFDERFRGATIEDMELGYRLGAAGKRIVQVHEARVEHRHPFDLVGWLRNDYRKARDWAGVLARGSGGWAQHGATQPREMAAAACAAATWAGAGLFWAFPVGPALAAAGLYGLRRTLRDDVRIVADEHGRTEVLPYLMLRAGTYPAAVVGAARGLVDAWRRQ